uniref:AC4 protein n=1 Tax=Clerodendron yellow mosaic virus TaxID=326811 RepID=A0A0K0PAR9_9GEMI|nr:AC4 protein [Clerodendron yellow mosaic virus]
MGLCISMLSYNSRVKPSSEMRDISMSLIPTPPPNSIHTSRELNPAPTSIHTSTRTEILWNGVEFRSTAGLHGEANSRQMMLQLRH